MPARVRKEDGGVAHDFVNGPTWSSDDAIGDDAVTADAAVGRLDSDHAAKGCRLANRSSGVGAERGQAFVGRDGRSGSAGRSAGDALEVVADWWSAPKAEFSVEEPIANSSMLALPTKTAPSARRRCDHGRVEGRDEIFENSRRAGRANATGRVDVLDAEWNPAQRGAFPDVRGARRRRAPARSLRFSVTVMKRMQLRLDRSDSIEACAGEFARGNLARAKFRRCASAIVSLFRSV